MNHLKKCKLVTIVCLVSSVLIYLTLMSVNEDKTITVKNPPITGPSHYSPSTPMDPQITLLLRMPGSALDHRARYYCDFFRSTVLFWPPSYGKTVLVLDEESAPDHEFGEIVISHTRKHFPEYKLEVLYEALPKDKAVLEFPHSLKPPGYNRQLWSSFFFDLYTNDSIIAWMDSDAAFITPVTNSSIFNGTKLRVLGWGCTFHIPWVKKYAETAMRALALPCVADFMSYFPVYIYRDTFTHCREYIMKRMNASDFEQAFKSFYLGDSELSPVIVVLSYAWFFERDRYDWHMQVCTNLTEYNKQFPVDSHIRPQHLEDVLSQPQTAFHVRYGEFLSANILISYCLSHEAAGNQLDVCLKHNFSLSNNFDLLHHDLQRLKKIRPNTCAGNNTDYCLQVLRDHYHEVGLEIKENGRKLDWRGVKTVEDLAKGIGITCKPWLY